MIEEIDAGPIYTKFPVSLRGTAEQIFSRVGKKCWKQIKWIVDEQPTPAPQEGTPVLFKRRLKSDSRLSSEGELTSLYDFIRMLDAPTYPCAFIDYGEFRIEFRKAKLKSEELIAHVKITRNEI